MSIQNKYGLQFKMDEIKDMVIDIKF